MTKQPTSGEIGDLTHNLADGRMIYKSVPLNQVYYNVYEAVKAYIADLRTRANNDYYDDALFYSAFASDSRKLPNLEVLHFLNPLYGGDK